MVQLSHPYVTTGKTMGLIRQTFVGKVMSMLLRVPWTESWVFTGRTDVEAETPILWLPDVKS